ncbi:GNAT family N-acetyltransferase [Vibrio breoganii]|uniref:GNAT family N-acetyltransferase n=1 Tax=Vibrio breoganii TaxID=553239 RepID=UPI000C83A7C6|nr:GNAT family N-acetyltransferase [Vibrio breoganii]PMO55309.1 GNAT family N-acetyltransferase [Vibrio breoganii]
MKHVQIVESSKPQCSQFRSWCIDEWSQDIVISSPDVPQPIFALCDGELAGGMAFSLFEQPFTDKKVVWINALLVKPDCRGSGIGSKLIEEATRQCGDLNQQHLYVYTNRPTLYTRLGWQTVPNADAEPQHWVLCTALS